jgi:fumarate reductase subunit C
VSKRKPYVRSMDGWWKKNPFYVEYMIHEGTALFVAAYAITLLVGLVRLGQGEAAWNGWLEAMKSPLSLVCHLVFLVAISYHAYTWFKLFPLTMPPIMVNGKRLEPGVVVGSGWTAAIVAALALLGLVWRIAA